MQGITTRAELIEIQSAGSGRRYTGTMDRRPLDPPPVIKLKLSRSALDPLTGLVYEREMTCTELDDASAWMGYVCTADLFRVAEDGQENAQLEVDSIVTASLIGQKEVQPQLVDYLGEKSLLFVFSDLSVKIEGNFILRYRAYDLCSHVTIEGSDNPVYPLQAECQGGTFRVYSTRDFPGLQPSTELTKHLALYGVKVAVRPAERRRESSERAVSRERPLYTTAPVRRRAHARSDGGDEEVFPWS